MKVLITDRFGAEGVSLLRSAGHEVVEAPGIEGAALLDAVRTAHALVIRSLTKVDRTLLQAAPVLEVIGRAGVGYENVDVPACREAGVAMFNTPGASAITTAERTLALLFSALHQIPAADRSLRAGRWDRRSFMANESFGKTLGILGFGNVGRVVADRARAFGMKIVVHDPNVAPETPFNLGYEWAPFDEVFKRADIITCHVSADPKLKGLVGARELGLMRPGGWLVNTSRGFIVDEAALVAALQSGQLKCAALDVFETEPLPKESVLRTLENVVISPHLGASTTEAEKRVAFATAQGVAEYLAKGTTSNLVVVGNRHKA